MGSIASAITGSGSRKAARAQEAAAVQAMQTSQTALRTQILQTEQTLEQQREMLEIALSRTEPFVQSGYSALSLYESLLYGISVEDTPAYKTTLYEQRVQEEFQEFMNNPVLPEGLTKTGANTYTDGTRSYSVAADGTIYQTLRGPGPDPIRVYRPDPADFVPSEPPPDVFLSQDQIGSVDPMGIIRETPGYDFRLSEGQKALERSAASRSGVLSGAQLKAQERYAQDFASNEYQNYLNRLSQTIGIGANAAAGQATGILNTAGNQANINLAGQQLTQNAFQNIAGAQTQVGAARASGYLGEQAAGTNLLNSAASIAGAYYGGGGFGGGFGGFF